MAWQLRVAGSHDLAPIMAIESSTFGTDAWTDSAMRADLGNRHTYYLVAFHPETPDLIEGYAGLLSPVGSGEGDIQTIAVAESARRQGLGRMLMQALIAEARARRATALFLEVRADNPTAQQLYVSLGFEEIAVRPKYYQPDGVDARIMRLSIAEPRLSPAVGA
ncbi:ribosomal-protein-alanine N-acetyltransferase [Glaciihabitans tibetensis]|uniref:Ribosomal-protein-alanine N-acetyltransferase n=1 Tax=Glaciihabitans tibetensis TaxID=1266600 RepID=A0A2T0VBN2_9MICO|nr:ribosomal protein S18-alanine N-acetyltransferase [Glaciihabitans tibetensis]PRY67592.1 ribosomal-protein-alanine N-acetyltransferase [Glaciihabitans tibetensis]